MIEWGTTNKQRTFTGKLKNVKDIIVKEQVQNPAIIIVGKVVRLWKKIKWFENKGLPHMQ